MRGEQGASGEVSPGDQGHPGTQCHQHSDGALLVSGDQCRLYCVNILLALYLKDAMKVNARSKKHVKLPVLCPLPNLRKT